MREPLPTGPSGSRFLNRCSEQGSKILRSQTP